MLRKCFVYIFLGMVLVCAFILGCREQVEAQPLLDQFRERLRARIEAAGMPPLLAVGDEQIHATLALPAFYEKRGYDPAWSGDNGPLPVAEALLATVRDAGREGLTPEDYHLIRIEAILGEAQKSRGLNRSLNLGRLADLDLLLTDAFMVYGSHLLSGCVNPETFDAEWLANRRGADFSEVLQRALTSGQVREALEGLAPPQEGYQRLRQALMQCREAAQKGGWPAVPGGPKMVKGDQGERILALRSRLAATGDLRFGGGGEDVFDDALEQAVRRFQRRHGLDADGVVGVGTLKALNVPAEQRVRQIVLNMERWRWLPQDLGERYVLVNIVNFELDVVEAGQALMVMRVVVGRPYRRTPVFSDMMTYLVLSPYWHVPPMIAIQDMLPQVRKDVGYLTEKRIRVFRGWGAEAEEIDPKTIDWAAVSGKSFPYRFRQEPGPANALGRIKFMFPNKFNVYLHDTPARDLFAKTARTFSSGCIRIEKPIDLAEYALKGDAKWTQEALLAAIDKGVEQTVRLPTAIPVHLLYWTAWTDGDGMVHFREDIYERDRRLDEAMRKPPPTVAR